MSNKRVTIKDVAKAANVSAMTVSNVINNQFKCVSAGTKLKVEQEILRLKYRRQTSARNLRTAHQYSVGMIVIDESPMFLTDFFTTQLVAGLANVLNNADYTMTIQGIKINNLVNSNIMHSLEVGGFCVMMSGLKKERNNVIKQLQSLKQPLIIFQQEIDEKNDDICVIRQDDWNGGQLIGQYLLSQDVQDYLVIRPKQNWPAIENRIKGLEKILNDSKRNYNINFLESESEAFIDVQKSISNYLDNNTISGAIFGCNDQTAYASISILKDKGYNIPHDVKVVGFNGFEAHRHLKPNLTTVISSAYEMGQLAGESMLNYFSKGYFVNSDIILPVSFSIGATS